MFEPQLRAAIEAAPRERLTELSAALWKAFGAGAVTEAEAGELSELIEARKAVTGGTARPLTGTVQLGQVRSLFPPKRRQRAPERIVLAERRRGLAASGWMPPALASRFTMGEQAVLAVVAREIVLRGACELCVDAVAALAGTSRRLVQAAIRLAHDTGLILVTERRRRGDRNLPNRITMLSREWLAWTKRRGGGGCKSSHPMSSRATDRESHEAVETGQRASGGRRAGSSALDSRPVRFARPGQRGAEACGRRRRPDGLTND